MSADAIERGREEVLARAHALSVNGNGRHAPKAAKTASAANGRRSARSTPRANGAGVVATPMSLAEARGVFRRWLGQGYDIEACDTMLCTVAAARLSGDPLWTMILSGPGNAKTETVQAARGAGAIITSTIASEGAFLSGTSNKERASSATGGLLRTIGDRGVLVIKDFTSILSMDRNTRAGVLAALREIHDGRWVRHVGTDGGRSLAWAGHLGVLAACTTTYDRAHEVISSMGDRFVLLRMDSSLGRQAAGRQAMANTGHEVEMREALAAAVAGVIAGMQADLDLSLTEDETSTLLSAADLVTLARTAVDYDYRGEVIDSHAPEMPTRFAKQLAQLMRGGLALGMAREEAMHLAVRCARDSMPPLRLSILLDVASHRDASMQEVRRRLEKPRTTVDRQLQSLYQLGLLTCTEDMSHGGTVWRYRIAAGVNPAVLEHAHTLTRKVSERGLGVSREAYPPSHNSGQAGGGLFGERGEGEPDEADLARAAMRGGA